MAVGKHCKRGYQDKNDCNQDNPKRLILFHTKAGNENPLVVSKYKSPAVTITLVFFAKQKGNMSAFHALRNQAEVRMSGWRTVVTEEKTGTVAVLERLEYAVTG